MTESLDDKLTLANFAIELRKWWSFDDRQMHTHSWHSREDFIKDKLPELLSALTPLKPTQGVADILRSLIVEARVFKNERTGVAWSRSPDELIAKHVALLSTSPVPAEDGWKTMESAPKLGKIIWVGCEHCIRLAWWDIANEKWVDYEREHALQFEPTAWQPIPKLPAPPVKAG